MSDHTPVILSRLAVQRSFSKAASSYDAAAVLQRKVADQLLERLDPIRIEPRVVLDLGCGTGYCIKPLERRFRKARVLALDLALPMLRQAKSKQGWRHRQQLVTGDAHALPLEDQSVDLVFSGLTIQWCDPDRVFGEIARVLAPGGLLMFSSFGPDTLKELRAAWSAVDNQVHVHDFIDMHDLGDAVLRSGLAQPVVDREDIMVTYATVRSLLRDLRAIGAHNAAADRKTGLTGKRQFARFEAAYKEIGGSSGRINSTFEVVYGHAWRSDAVLSQNQIASQQVSAPEVQSVKR